jgi:glutamyl-tRNA synthetase
MAETVPVRVRFAPSPTGYLHVGGARTALFNWLLARQRGGVFVLRIEDTDAERSSDAMVTGILDGLRWLGLDWDEGPIAGGPHAPYFQSERLDRHRALAAQLAAAGHAYPCYCTTETLQRKRDEAQARGESTQYDRTCLSLAPDEIARLDAANTPRAIRFKVPAGGQTRFVDLVHGEIQFDHANIEDFVILRSDGLPTYHLSVVADDVDMGITQVIRGDDHISNTPKHVLLFEALAAPVPQFAHVPLILGTDKKRLSKRHGATSVIEYARLGYLPEAMMNFLALLGWSPGASDQELFTRDELVAAFSLGGISGGNAVFNPEKLDWVNGQHIMRLSSDELARRVEPWLREAGLWDDAFSDGDRRTWLLQVIDLLKPRAKRLDELAAQARPFLVDIDTYDPGVAKKHWTAPDTGALLTALAERLDTIDPFEPAGLEQATRALAEERGVKAGALIHATRLALTGSGTSPGLFEVMTVLGRGRVRTRLLRAVVEILQQQANPGPNQGPNPGANSV